MLDILEAPMSFTFLMGTSLKQLLTHHQWALLILISRSQDRHMLQK